MFLSDVNDDAGRAKLAEYLYKEYSLEQIIYQLSKVRLNCLNSKRFNKQ